jgi:hypothetical protein
LSPSVSPRCNPPVGRWKPSWKRMFDATPILMMIAFGWVAKTPCRIAAVCRIR